MEAAGTGGMRASGFKTKLLDALRWAPDTSQASLAISMVMDVPL